MSQRPRKTRPAVTPSPLSGRQPTQDRAKARVELILATATDLIAETGSDAVRMTEVAVRAGIPIGSLYQYFPDKAAILRMLALRFMERVREELRAQLENINSGEEALARVDTILESYYAIFLTEPVVRDIWSGTQSDKALQEIDIEDSRANGDLVFAKLKAFVKKADHKRFEAACFLLMQLSGAAVRLAIVVERAEGDRLMTEFCRMAQTEMRTFLRAGAA